MARVLMVNLPYSGHTNPTLPLATALVARGHQVGYINAPAWQEKIEETGAEFIPYPDYPVNLSRQQQKTRCFKAAYEAAMAVGSQYDLLIYEMLFYPGQVIAERLNIPCVRQFSQAAWNEVTLAAVGNRGRLFRLSSRLIDRQMMNRRTTQALKMPDRRLLESILFDKPPLNIVYVPEMFQFRRDSFDPSYHFVSPPVRRQAVDLETTKKNQAPSCSWGNLAHPLIYISLGSILSSKAFCRRCLKAFANREVTVIMATGRVSPESLGPLPRNVHVFSFAPQLEILAQADLFITHGGMNSVNEAMHFGVPMLVLPLLNDQPFNAEQVVRLGLGQKASPFATSAKRLYQQAMSLLQNSAIRQTAHTIQQQMTADIGLYKVIAALESLLP